MGAKWLHFRGDFFLSLEPADYAYAYNIGSFNKVDIGVL